MSFLAICPKYSLPYSHVIKQRFWLFRYLIGNQLKSTNVNNIEAFINDLVQTKSTKWEWVRKNFEQQRPNKEASKMVNFQTRSKTILAELSNLEKAPLEVDIKCLDQYQIDNLIITSLDNGNENDLYILLSQLLEYRKLPSEGVTKEIMQFLCDRCDGSILEKLISLCASDFREFYCSNLQFKHFESLLLWKKGNATQSLKEFRDIYVQCDNEVLRESLMEMLSLIVDETLGGKSEGVLVGLTDFGKFLSTNFDDYHILMKIWMSSFKSIWFSDNCLAQDLFENDGKIRSIVGQKSSFLSYLYLKEHNLEAAHRLIELFLKFNMKFECRNVLMVLFDYHYWYNDLRACSEIIQNSIDLEIELPESYNLKLLNLLLKRPTKVKIKKSEFKMKF